MLVWTTDTLARQKGYAAPGDFPFSPALIAKAGDFRQGLAPFVNAAGQYVEYHLVAPDKAGSPAAGDRLARESLHQGQA